MRISIQAMTETVPLRRGARKSASTAKMSTDLGRTIIPLNGLSASRNKSLLSPLRLKASYDLCNNVQMTLRVPPKIVSAERINGGVVITFSSGEEGLYSDGLLYASLPAARELLAKASEMTEASELSRANEKLLN